MREREEEKRGGEDTRREERKEEGKKKGRWKREERGQNKYSELEVCSWDESVSVLVIMPQGVRTLTSLLLNHISKTMKAPWETLVCTLNFQDSTPKCSSKIVSKPVLDEI
jgi:hypothetical protein